MLVKDCMTRHPVMISSKAPASEAQKLMAENKVRHLPVVGDGKRLQGLITRQRLALKPDVLGSLNVWEITRYLSNMSVKKVMLPAKKVVTIEPDRTVERAARLLTDHDIGCLPVLEDGVVVGIISERTLLQAFQEMMGLAWEGVRVTIRVPDSQGQYAKLMGIVAEHKWGIMGIGSFPSPRNPEFYDMVLKVSKVSKEEVLAAWESVPDQNIIDIRELV